jgi:hypothetical protein
MHSQTIKPDKGDLMYLAATTFAPSAPSAACLLHTAKERSKTTFPRNLRGHLAAEVTLTSDLAAELAEKPASELTLSALRLLAKTAIRRVVTTIRAALATGRAAGPAEPTEPEETLAARAPARTLAIASQSSVTTRTEAAEDTLAMRDPARAIAAARLPGFLASLSSDTIRVAAGRVGVAAVRVGVAAGRVGVAAVRVGVVAGRVGVAAVRIGVVALLPLPLTGRKATGITFKATLAHNGTMTLTINPYLAAAKIFWIIGSRSSALLRDLGDVLHVVSVHLCAILRIIRIRNLSRVVLRDL